MTEITFSLDETKYPNLVALLTRMDAETRSRVLRVAVLFYVKLRSDDPVAIDVSANLDDLGNGSDVDAELLTRP